jgi:hypothetical protein
LSTADATPGIPIQTSDHGGKATTTWSQSEHHSGKDSGFARSKVSGEAQIKARMTSELRSNQKGISLFHLVLAYRRFKLLRSLINNFEITKFSIKDQIVFTVNDLVHNFDQIFPEELSIERIINNSSLNSSCDETELHNPEFQAKIDVSSLKATRNLTNFQLHYAEMLDFVKILLCHQERQNAQMVLPMMFLEQIRNHLLLGKNQQILIVTYAVLSIKPNWFNPNTMGYGNPGLLGKFFGHD